MLIVFYICNYIHHTSTYIIYSNDQSCHWNLQESTNFTLKIKKNSDSEYYFMHLQIFGPLHRIRRVSVDINDYVKMDDMGAPQKWSKRFDRLLVVVNPST